MPRSTSSTPIAPSGTATPQPATSPDSAGPARSVASGAVGQCPTRPGMSGGMARVVAGPPREAQAPTARRCDNRGMDRTDREILGELVRNARISYRDLGARVGLSANAAAGRGRRLERTGVITGFTATLDPGAAGRRLHALVDVRMGAADTNDSFEAAVAGLEAVTDPHHATGRFDCQPRVAFHDPAELDRLLRHLKTQLGVVETETRVVLRSAIARSAA